MSKSNFKLPPAKPPNDDIKRLDAVLHDLKHSYKNNPLTLLNSFPALDLWRFFIDGYRQDTDANFDNQNYILLNAMFCSTHAHSNHPDLYKVITPISQAAYGKLNTQFAPELSRLQSNLTKEVMAHKWNAASLLYDEIVDNYNLAYDEVSCTMPPSVNKEIYNQYKEFVLFIIDPNDYKLSIKDFLDKHPIYFSIIESMLRRHTKIQLFVPGALVLTDAMPLETFIKRQRAWFPFEYTEPGYLKAVMHAQQVLVDQLQQKKPQLSVELIKKTHQTATHDVKNTNYEGEKNDKAGNFRKLTSTNYRSFELVKSNTTLAGLSDMFTKIKNGVIPIELRFEVRNESLITKKVNFNTEPAVIFNSFVLNKNKYYRLRTFGLIPQPKSTFHFLNLFRKFSNQDAQVFFDTTFSNFISTFNKSIENAKTPLEKLTAIVTFIQNCEQAHFFYDANCRTLCMNIFNFLLMAHGFPPAILTDPNRFDAYSVTELVKEAIIGMERTLKIAKGKKVFRVTTEQMLSYATETEIAYFESAIKQLRPNFAFATLKAVSPQLLKP